MKQHHLLLASVSGGFRQGSFLSWFPRLENGESGIGQVEGSTCSVL